MTDDLAALTAREQTDLFRRGELSPVEAVDAALARAERLQPRLNAFQVLDPETARAAARKSEARWRAGTPAGPLDGVAMSIKDTMAVAGWPTRVGSLTTPAAPSAADAPVAERLRAAGAVFIGKTTTPEFGWKGMTDSPLAGITRSPWNPERTPGGSSGGAGASVAAGITAIAHGSDGGGSIRIPASYCGLFGLKPTLGRVPHVPCSTPHATNIQDGPLARSVADAAAMLSVIAGPDARDWHAFPHPPVDFSAGLEDGVAGLRIGLSLDLGGAEPEAEIARAVRDAAGRLQDLGAEVKEVGPLFPPLEPVFENYWLAGFGQRLAAIEPAARELLDPGFRALSERGLAVTLEEFYAGYTARAGLGVQMKQFHLAHDLLLTPTMPTPPPTVDTIYHSQGFHRWNHAVPYTVPFNLTGQPAASYPVGVDRSGLPVGLQIVASHGGEALILRAAKALETVLPFPWPHPALEVR